MEWQVIKKRSAGDGEVLVSDAGDLYMRTGSLALQDEVEFQQALQKSGYPVPKIVEDGTSEAGYFFIEKSIGSESLHDLALGDFEKTGHVTDETLEKITATSSQLLIAQLRTANPEKGNELVDGWFEKASYIANVLEENPDFRNPRTFNAIQKLREVLKTLPFAMSHQDYGLPNAFEHGVIDWQHGTDGPVGYDVYTMLEIIPFKGGNRGYSFTSEQRKEYIARLDEISEKEIGKKLSTFLPEFLMVKSYFFLALMKPADLKNQDKVAKWNYRRHLADEAARSYINSGRVDTSKFPTLDDFKQQQPARK